MGTGSGNSPEAPSQGSNKHPVQSRANVVLAGEARAGAQQGGGGTTGVTVHAAALHWGPDRLETGEGGSTRGTKVVWRLKKKELHGVAQGQAKGRRSWDRQEGSGGLWGCRGGSPGQAGVIPWDGHRAAGDVPSWGPMTMQSDTAGINTSPHPVFADTLLLLLFLLQQLWCFHQTGVTGASRGSIRAAPTPPTPAEGLILPGPPGVPGRSACHAAARAPR